MASRRTLLLLSTLAALALLAGACAEEVPVEGALCDAAHPCPDGLWCDRGVCAPAIVTGCTEDAACPTGACLLDAGFCVQCTRAEHCPRSTCLPGVHVCGCERGEDCLTGRCNAATGTCVSCYAHVQCPSGACDLDTGICQKVRR